MAQRIMFRMPQADPSLDLAMGLDTGDPLPSNKGRIPLPDYKNPASRLAYAQAFTKKYGPFMQGRGDSPLRINEIPYTSFDRLTAKQAATNAAKRLGLDPALFYSSAMEEGMSGTFKKGYEGEEPFNSSSYPDYPISGFATFGLDNFGSNVDPLIKKGYLPADFGKRIMKTMNVNEKGETTQSANFRSVEDALTAKAAMMRQSQDQISEYAKSHNIELSPKAKQFFSLINYNAGEGNAQKMLQSYYKSGALKGDSFLNARPAGGWKEPYENVIRRTKMADALMNEGYFDEPAPPPKAMLRIQAKK